MCWPSYIVYRSVSNAPIHHKRDDLLYGLLTATLSYPQEWLIKILLRLSRTLCNNLNRIGITHYITHCLTESRAVDQSVCLSVYRSVGHVELAGKSNRYWLACCRYCFSLSIEEWRNFKCYSCSTYNNHHDFLFLVQCFPSPTRSAIINHVS